MSQYPAPYPPYPPPESSPDALLRPARRAGVLMIVLGVLFVSGGLCYAAMSFMLQSGDLMATPQGQDLQRRLNELESRAGGSGSVTRNIVIQGAVLLGVGAALGALGMVVRGGRRRPMIASIVVCSILAVFIGLSTLATLLAGAVLGMAPAEVFTGLCAGTVLLVLLALLLVWLIQALRGEGALAQTRQQWDAQMAYYRQQQTYYQHQPPQQQPTQPQQGRLPSDPSPQAPTPPTFQPPAGGGGYHQSPTPAQPPTPTTTPTTQTSRPGTPDPGGSSDGPPAQG